MKIINAKDPLKKIVRLSPMSAAVVTLLSEIRRKKKKNEHVNTKHEYNISRKN